jgi:hypothetical protein
MGTATADVNKPIFIGGGGEGHLVAGTRVGLLILASLLTVSCDRSDYVITLKRTHIDSVDRLGGSGYIVVGKVSADTMAKYGDVYVQGRTCPDDSCKTISVGSLSQYDQVQVEDGVRLKLEPLFVPEADKDYPPFWLGNIACFRIEATQGFMGRTGRSDWNCSVTSSRPK